MWGKKNRVALCVASETSAAPVGGYIKGVSPPTPKSQLAAHHDDDDDHILQTDMARAPYRLKKQQQQQQKRQQKQRQQQQQQEHGDEHEQTAASASTRLRAAYPPFGNKRHLGNARVIAKFPGNKASVTIPTVPCNIHTIVPENGPRRSHINIHLPSPHDEGTTTHSETSTPVSSATHSRASSSHKPTTAPIVDSNMSLNRKKEYAAAPVIHQPLTPPPPMFAYQQMPPPPPPFMFYGVPPGPHPPMMPNYYPYPFY